MGTTNDDRIPDGAAGITAGWMASVTGWDVQDVAVDQIGVGIGVSSAVYRATLTGSDAPPAVVVKLAALDEAAVFTSTVLRMYQREVAFFDRLAPASPVRVPAAYFAEVNDDGSRFVVVMEDMGGLRDCDQITGMGLADAERAVDALASWHAQWWGAVDGLAESGAAVALGDPIYPALLPSLFEEGWAKIGATDGLAAGPALAEVGPRFPGAIEKLLRQLDQAPVTLLHGDFRADNILFAGDGSPVLLDFQIIGTGSGAYDLAYFVTQSLDEETAAHNEASLFERWKLGLVAAGAPESDLDRMWEDYRAAALFCLVYPGVAVRGMDLADPRQFGLAGTMLQRLERAADTLRLAELL